MAPKQNPQRNENWTTPVDAPMYGPLPTVYRDVVFNTVYFRTDPANIAPLLPEPFEPGEDGICAALAIEVAFSSSYGPFNEMGVVAQVTFRGQKGFYLAALYLNNDSAIAAGREIYGSPKKMAEVTFEDHGEVFVATCRRSGIDIIRLTSRILTPAKEDDFIPVFPIFNLKMIPRIDKPEPAIKQVTSAGVDNAKLRWLYKAAGTVQFQPSVSGDFARLQPQEILGASRSKMDYEQGFGEVVYDYLAE